MKLTKANKNDPRATVPRWNEKYLDIEVLIGAGPYYPLGPCWKYQIQTDPAIMNSVDAIIKA